MWATTRKINISDEIERLKTKSKSLTRSIFADLIRGRLPSSPATRHGPMRWIICRCISPDFQELHGDRMYGDDPAHVGGPGRLDGTPGDVHRPSERPEHKSACTRNYGMPNPRATARRTRLMAMAERFRLPVITLIDTPGAYPGVGAEERGQSEAIARNLFQMAS